MPSFPVIQQDQYTATSDTQCIQIIIPDGDEYKALLAGMLQPPANALNYADPESAQAEGVAAAWSDALALIDWNACMEPSEVFSSRLVLWGAEMKIIAGNGWQWNQLTSQDLEGYWRQSVAAQFDEVELFVAVPPGIYRIDLFGVKFSGAAKQSIKWNGNAISDIDWYANPSQIRQLIQPGNDMTVTGDEGLTINSKVNSRNASNTTGWYIGITWMKIRRTGNV